MKRMGLNAGDRQYVATLVLHHQPSEYVREAMSDRLRENDWSREKNIKFLGWLRAKGYHGTADRLARGLGG
jgi:hypothetical protein